MRHTPEIGLLDTAGLLRRFGLRPKKRLGQHFLQDPAALEQVVEAAGIAADDVVLEIGPGLGSLTRYLARAARRVIAIEVDAAFEPPLREVLRGSENVELVFGDFLQHQLGDLGLPPGYLIVANVPYYITSAIVRHSLESRPAPRRIVFTLQSEVVRRICAVPGELSLLALSVQVFGQPSKVGEIPAGAFHPRPDVDSAILRVDVFPSPHVAPGRLDAFFRLVRAGFSQRRKMLRNALRAGLRREPAEIQAALARAGIDGQRRAETLSIPEWNRLLESLDRKVDGSEVSPVS